MSDTPGTPSPETPSTPPPPPTTPSGVPSSIGESMKDAEEGKLFAILSYALNIIGIPFWIAPLLMRNNDFALYHSKQCGFMWIAGFAMFIVNIVLAFIPFFGCLTSIAFLVVGLGMLVLNILGLINAAGMKAVPVPIVGEIGLNLFKGVTKKA